MARSRLHWLLHQRAHRGSSLGGGGGSRQAGPRERLRDGCTRVHSDQAASRSRRSGPDLSRGWLRLARIGMLDVSRHEPGHLEAGRAMCVNLEPELRGAAGQGRKNSPGQPVDGRGGGNRRALRRHTGLELMQPFTLHAGLAVPLERSNVDTDQIIPKQFLKRIERTGFGQFLFFDWRFDESGNPSGAFELNEPRYAGASILLAGRNFGCGSSREHAVWSLADYGFRAIISSSFADIFANNSVKNGFLTVRLKEEQLSEVLRRAAEIQNYGLAIDLERCEVSDDQGFRATFPLDEFVRHCLLNGLDDICLTLQHESEITTYEAANPLPQALMAETA